MNVNFPITGSQASVRPPICAICTPGDEPRIVLVQKGKGIRHWPNEGHVPNNAVRKTEKRPESPIKRTDVPEKEVVPVGPDEGQPPRQFNSAGGGRGKGRPKKWKSEAERKAAYRERRK